MATATAPPIPKRSSRKRAGLRCRIRLADGRLFAGELPPERHRALQIEILHRLTHGLVELAAGTRQAGRLLIKTRRRADHFLPGGAADGEGWLEALLELAARHADRGEEVFLAPAARITARGDKHAVSATRFLWVDIDDPGQLHKLWALFAERPCHLLIAPGGSGGAHAYWKLDQSLPATRVDQPWQPIERANLQIVHALGVGADGKPNVGDAACAERSRVMRLAGTVNAKTGAYARVIEANLALPAYPIERLVGDLPDPAQRIALRASTRAQAQTRTSGSARPSTSRSSLGSSCRATPGLMPGTLARGQGSVLLDRHKPRAGLVLPRRRVRRARSDLRPGLGANRRDPGAGSCAVTRSSAPAPFSPMCSASALINQRRRNTGETRSPGEDAGEPQVSTALMDAVEAVADMAQCVKLNGPGPTCASEKLAYALYKSAEALALSGADIGEVITETCRGFRQGHSLAGEEGDGR